MDTHPSRVGPLIAEHFGPRSAAQNFRYSAARTYHYGTLIITPNGG